MDTEEIREKFRDMKRHRKCKLKDIYEQTGISLSTLNRFERGVGTMSAENLFRIGLWCGYFPQGLEIANGNTLENIKRAIDGDLNLSGEQKAKIWNIFKAMYRAAKKFKKPKEVVTRSGKNTSKAKGAYARAKKLSPERRSEIARKAARKRWSNLES